MRPPSSPSSGSHKDFTQFPDKLLVKESLSGIQYDISTSTHSFESYNLEIQLVIHTRATPKIPAAPPAKNTSSTYSPGIHGWDLSWLELLVARLCPSSSHSSISSQDKSQPCIPGEYVGLTLLPGGHAGIIGVALVSYPISPLQIAHLSCFKILRRSHFNLAEIPKFVHENSANNIE